MGLLESQLAAKRLDSSSVHLADPRCSSSQEINGTVWFQMERWEGSCGTTLTVRRRLLYQSACFYLIDQPCTGWATHIVLFLLSPDQRQPRHLLQQSVCLPGQ